MNSAPVMSDDEARDAAIDPRRSVLVQAPAGSGKTTLLTQRLLALLARVSVPERVLALTFSRKAAAEMRSRVFEALQSASTGVQGKLHPRTWELAQQAHRHLLGQGVDLVRHPARLRVETIDGFCAWLAAQLPVTSGAGGRVRVAEDAVPYYREAAERALATEQEWFAGSVDRALQLNDEAWSSVREQISDMLGTRNSWLGWLVGRMQATRDPSEQAELVARRLLDEDLALLIERHLERVAEAMGGERLGTLHALLGGAAGRLGAGKSILSRWRTPPDSLRPVAAQVNWWREIANVLLNSNNQMRSRFDSTVGFPPGSADKGLMKDLASELGRDPSCVEGLASIRSLPDPAYDEAQWGRVRALSRTLVLAAAELDVVFRGHAINDFPGVFQAAIRALGSPSEPTDLALLLDHRIEHILVDECQDTSNPQLDLFKLLTAGWRADDGRTFFCVGDPMQSIYGFRDAEVRVFLELAEEGMGSIHLDQVCLTSNFRAQRPLVDWVNATFSRIFPRRNDRHRGAIAFVPAVASTQGSTGAGVNLRLFESSTAEAWFVARTVQAALAAGSVRRIAVLVRNKRQAWRISQAMRDQGIGFSAVDIGRLQDMAVVRDILSLSRALLHLEDRIAWLALLRSPFVGLALHDLALLSQGSGTLWQNLNTESVIARMSSEGAARCRRLAEILAQAFAARDQSGFARWIERTWLALGGPATGLDGHDRDCARAALDRLALMERQGLPDPGRFEEAFGDAGPVMAGGQKVEIMTIHKAKGLEFDMVFVPALDAFARHSSRDFIQTLAFAREDRPGFMIAARPATGDEPDPVVEFLRHCDKDAQRLEAQRLLYVACTRARSELHLSAVAASVFEDPARPFNPTAGSLLRVLWPILGDRFVPVRVDAPKATSAPAMLRRLPAGWVPAEPGITSTLPPVAPLPVAPPFDWVGETARQIGVLVHRCLQDLRCDAQAEGGIRARLSDYRRWFEVRGVPEGQIEWAAKRVMDTLLAVLADPRGRWILEERRGHDRRELALSAFLDGRVSNVVLDRTFLEAGERWIIDYKTSVHGGGRLETFLDSEMQRYAPQMRRYVRIVAMLGPEPVRAGLYFPLLREFREYPKDF